MELVVPKNHAAFIFISGTTKVKFRYSEKATQILTSGKCERFEQFQALILSFWKKIFCSNRWGSEQKWYIYVAKIVFKLICCLRLLKLNFEMSFWCLQFSQIRTKTIWLEVRISVQGVKSLGGHLACLCRGFEFYEVKKNWFYFSKSKCKYFYTFNHFYSEKSSKRIK